ncbi:MAG TPA: DMT family transporter [Xanthobacteraceae bacterium]|nr:DMT family transporter [Xanthobacteraceae bacterium]
MHNAARPLDLFAVCMTIGLCFAWGFNQVAAKVALAGIPPFTQGAIRSLIAAGIVAGWMRLRGIPLFKRDGTLRAGLAAGVLFGLEFLLIYPGLMWTTATRAVLFIYLAPFFVVLGARFFLPADRFVGAQWAGLVLSFAGMVVAFGLPTPAADPRQALGDVLMVLAAAAWAATTLVIKASVLNRAPFEKTMLYQLVVSAPMLGLAALLFGERVTAVPGPIVLAAMAYQTLFVVPVTFVAWFALIQRYSASRLSAFTFLTPIFGVLAGHLLLDEPLTMAFAAAVALVAAGLIMVNRVR